MLRRSFLKLVGAASVAALVTFEPFKHAPAAPTQGPDVPTRRIEYVRSEVLQAMDEWNQWRVQVEAEGNRVLEGGYVWDADAATWRVTEHPEVAGRGVDRMRVDELGSWHQRDSWDREVWEGEIDYRG